MAGDGVVIAIYIGIGNDMPEADVGVGGGVDQPEWLCSNLGSFECKRQGGVIIPSVERRECTQGKTYQLTQPR